MNKITNIPPRKILNCNNIGKLIYQTDKRNNNINIFNERFVKMNKNRAIIIINNKQYNLTSIINNKKKDEIFLKIKIKFLENMIDINSMFKDCNLLKSVKKFSNFNTKNLKKINA